MGNRSIVSAPHGARPTLDDLAAALPRVAGRVNAAEDGCWQWTGCICRGYGAVGHAGKQWRTHRLVFSVLVGPIPEGLVIDHLCKNKACCNPAHLEPVTQRENINRGPFPGGFTERPPQPTTCKCGREIAGDNAGVHNSKGYTRLRCKACVRAGIREWGARHEVLAVTPPKREREAAIIRAAALTPTASQIEITRRLGFNTGTAYHDWRRLKMSGRIEWRDGRWAIERGKHTGGEA